MRVRLLTLAALAGISVAAVPGNAAPAPKPQIIDPAGDANGVNDQDAGLPVPSQSTPTDVSAADITAVTFATTLKKQKVDGLVVTKPIGFTVTMTLSAAPTTPEIFYRVVATTAGCSEVFFEYGTDVAAGGSAVRCPGTVPTKDKTYSDAPAVIKGSNITWTLPLSAFPVGTKFSALSAQTRLNPAIITAPQLDAATSTATYTIGK
jgi:hypothetical protein